MVVFVDLSESLKSLLRNLMEVHNEFKTCYGDLVNCVCVYIQWKEIEPDLHKHFDRLGYVLFFYKRKLCLQHKTKYLKFIPLNDRIAYSLNSPTE